MNASMMNRRSFLTWALGTTAALTVLPAIEPLSILPTPQQDAAAWLSTYAELHREAYRLFKEFMASFGLPVADACVFADMAGTRLGYVLPDQTLVRHQLNVMLDSSVLERSVEPAMHVLAAKAAGYGMDRFGSLFVPHGGLDYGDNRGALRMIKCYQIHTDEDLVRFDVVGGSSPAGLRRISHRKQAELKARLLKKWGPPGPGRPVLFGTTLGKGLPSA